LSLPVRAWRESRVCNWHQKSRGEAREDFKRREVPEKTKKMWGD
jgi:hypothetical protein